ncbi:MAG TPA: glycosyltransferase family 39 protein [Chloroflexota bacterium]|nr:glycosyltransferase family 39 protein [Chloroflexota bacterium]
MQSRTLSVPAVNVRVPATTWPAETLVVGVILLGSAFMRLVRLSSVSGDLDEGIRGIQLLLVSAGYRPVQEIYSSQGPLLLDLLYPLYHLFGETLGAARLAVGFYSLIGILGAYCAGRVVGGPLGGAMAAVLLALSPTYLRNSRQALAEVPALAPAILAVAAALAYQRGGRWSWLLVSGLFLGLALLIKPIVVAAIVPIALAVVVGPRRPLRPLLLVGGVAAAFVLVIVLVTGLSAVLSQVIDYRLRSREVSGWDVRENWRLLQTTLGRDQIGLFALALAAGLAMLVASPRRALPLVLWPLASVGLLLAYSPLFPKHVVIAVPPVAVLAGSGIGQIWQAVRARQWQGMLGAVALAAGGLFYLWSAPAMFSWDARFMNLSPSFEGERFQESGDAATTIEALTKRGDFIITDHPYLAFLAQRLVPPELSDPSKTRVRARELTGEDIAAAGETYGARLVVLWSDRLRTLRNFKSWLDQRFLPVKVYGRGGDSPRVIYLRREADLAQARTALQGSIGTTLGADFGGVLRLRGYTVDRAELGRNGSVGVTYEWESLAPASVDYHIMTELRGPDGQVWSDEELALGNRAVGLVDWPLGRWLFQSSSFDVSATAPPGEYVLTVGVYDTRARAELPVTAGDARLGSRGGPLYRFELAKLQVK